MSFQQAQQIAEGSADALIAALEALQGRVAKRLMALAADLDTDDGRLVPTPQNILLLEEILSQARNEFVDEEFVDALSDYLESFDSITAQVIEGISALGEVDEEGLFAIDRAYKQQLAAHFTTPEIYGGSLWLPVANTILLGMATAAVLSDVIASIGETVSASGVVGAVEQEATSAPLQLERAVTQAASQQVGAEFFFYQGRPIKTTRPFCMEREGHAWHIDEIKGWARDANNGEDLDGNGKPGWAGMVEGTNEQNIFTYLGGWFGGRKVCRHVLIPIARDEVPEQDYKRMQKLGLVD